MNKVQVIARPEKVTAVVDALEAIGCVGLNITQVTGRGQQKGVQVFTSRGVQTHTVTLLPKVKIETVVADEMTDRVCETILSSARSGPEGVIGDGKIFISRISEVIRVRTGERGEAAVSSEMRGRIYRADRFPRAAGLPQQRAVPSFGI